MGHLARSHVYDDDKTMYQYSYDISTQYSMVLLDTALIHRLDLLKFLYKQ